MEQIIWSWEKKLNIYTTPIKKIFTHFHRFLSPNRWFIQKSVTVFKNVCVEQILTLMIKYVRIQENCYSTDTDYRIFHIFSTTNPKYYANYKKHGHKIHWDFQKNKTKTKKNFFLQKISFKYSTFQIYIFLNFSDLTTRI